MTQHEVEVKFHQYAELGKALDILKTMQPDEILKFMADAHAIYFDKTYKKPTVKK